MVSGGLGFWPLKIVRSRKLTLVVECSCVKWRLGWKVFRSCRNDASVSAVSVQMMKMSSMYRVKVSGLIFCVCRNEVMMEDIKMLAIVGENAAPIAVPLICWKMW